MSGLFKDKAVPIVFGLLVTSYWLIAFWAALHTPIFASDRQSPWWSFSAFYGTFLLLRRWRKGRAVGLPEARS